MLTVVVPWLRVNPLMMAMPRMHSAQFTSALDTQKFAIGTRRVLGLSKRCDLTAIQTRSCERYSDVPPDMTVFPAGNTG